ncbi:repair helicase UvrD [Natronomonas moolapensis 8.8.11]|uniref:DNA 3'-5' helicase n=1 Tax=Natronomonas moolapensis (strain DSM 18674 / CECT 7526 / JCM 14361 / 8.8.11) TaxID=268739 RepID=M1XPR7_NATM8|nr:ATP-dependent helicase [Natronomonas moolapensis]CCQ35994.1 repair helicase UvrD [Natronomonas moolapensis 8.8.11]
MTTATHVTRLFGGPGSGKTTALLDRVDEMLDDGVDVNDILVVSYTRAAAAEVRERLGERLDRSPKSLRSNVCTMHAKAYELLDLSRGDVVGEKHKEAFCEDYGIEFEDENKSSRRRSARSTTLGNKIIATSQWLQRTERDVADWYDVPFKWDEEEVRLPPEIDDNAQTGNKYTPTWPSDDDRLDIPEAIRAWRSYKGDEGVVGFADMLERVKQRSLLPSVDHLVIDEFQDITTLQYGVYDEWKPHVESVLIAGDDDQVVYAWQGADPNLLLDEDVEDDVVLPNSYRLPSRILNVVNTQISHIEKRQDKDLKPRKEGGSVEAVPSPSMLDLVRNVRMTVDQDDDGSVMCLFRARYQMFQFMDEFIGEGIPFTALTDQRMWTDRLQGYVDAIEALDDGDPIDGLQARRLGEMLADSAFGTGEREDYFDAFEALEDAEGVDDLTDLEVAPEFVDEHAPFAPGPRSAADMLTRVSNFQERSVDAYFSGDYRGTDPNRVRVGTIHSAKGREADHVFVATDLTEKVVEQMAASVEDPEAVPGEEAFTKRSDPIPTMTDNERRVFYVGMSRARERLVLLEDLVDGAPTLPIDVLLYNEPVEKSLGDVLSDAQQQGAELKAD